LHFLSDSTGPWNDLHISTTIAGQDYEGVLVGRAGIDFMLRAAHGSDTRIVIGHASGLPATAKSGASPAGGHVSRCLMRRLHSFHPKPRPSPNEGKPEGGMRCKRP
jgi:hypothetical protein